MSFQSESLETYLIHFLYEKDSSFDSQEFFPLNISDNLVQNDDASQSEVLASVDFNLCFEFVLHENL